MKTYTLTTAKDANGQPLRIFKANLENNVSKAIDQRSGICSGILADGVVTDQEAVFFADWARKFGRRFHAGELPTFGAEAPFGSPSLR